MYKSGNYPSIGCVELACDYLYYELVNSYPSVLEVLKNATSISQASDTVLHDFEKPADQSESVEEVRESLGKAIYTEFTGTGGTTPNEPIKLRKNQFNFLLFNKKRRVKRKWKNRIF